MKVLAAFLALSLSSVAFGQLRRSTGAPVLPAVSTAAPDGAFALETNPAALALQNGWDLAYVHADRVGDDELAARGDGLYGSTTLPFRLAIAASVDWIRPTTGAERGRFSLGAAWARSRRFALGGALRYSASSDPIGGVTSLDVSALWRPSSTITFSLVAHDLLGPAGLVTDAADVPATFALAAQLRPFATDGLTVEVVGALDTDGRVGVRALAAAVIPRIGRVWGSLEGDDLRDTSDLRATVGLDVRFGNGSVTGGAILGDDLTGWITAARLSSHERVGLPTPGYVDDIEVKSAGPRSLLALLNRLDRDRGDRRVRGVLLRLRGTSMGLAAAQEVRAAIGALQASGKPVVCHADTLSGSETYACSAAAGSYVDPAGYVRLLGPSLEVMNFGEALENVGVRADFVRIGDFKSAVEQYTNGAMSGPARLQRNALLDDVYTRMTEDMAVDRDVPPAAVRRWVDGGPYIADEAVDLGVATEILDEHDLGPILRETIGTSRRRRTPPEDARRTVGVPRRIAVVVVDGSIVDGNNVDLPIIEIHQTGGRTITQTLDALIADRTVAAIVVRIDSPGGSALASEQIWRAIRRARRSKPVIATMGAVAASGGYYIASACDEIYADPSTITGSIGIFFGKADFGPLANRLGVSVTQIGRGRHAGATSLYRPFTAEERGVIADKIRRFYRLFLQRVAEGREELDVEDVDRLGRGRVWTGDAAHAQGLVDHLGGYLAALDRARELAGLPRDAEVVTIPRRPGSLLDYVTSSIGVRVEEGDAPNAEADAPIPDALRSAVSLGAALSSGEVPMALMPGTITIR